MENQRETGLNTETRRQNTWEKPAVKAEYSIGELTQGMPATPGALDGLYS